MKTRTMIALWCMMLLTVTASVKAQVIRIVVTDVNGRAEYVEKGHKYLVRKGASLNMNTLLYIPNSGSVKVLDATTGKEYTFKTPGCAAVDDLIKASNQNVLTRTKDYVKSVLAQVSGEEVVHSRYISDPATVTREMYVSPAKVEKNPEKDKKRSFRDDYEEFKNKALQEYTAFRKKALQDYAKFVRDAWQEFGAEPPIPVPQEEEIAPMVVPGSEAETASWFGDLFRKVKNSIKKKTPSDKPVKKTSDELPQKEVIVTAPAPKQPAPEVQVCEQKKSMNDYMVFSLFGTECRVRIGDDCRFTLKSVEPDEVANAIELLSNIQFDNILYDCLKEREKHGFSDWAYYQMLIALTDNFYGPGSNEGTLVRAFLYSQSGYKMRLAHDGAKLYMLTASSHVIYERSMYFIGGETYYQLEGERNDKLRICPAKFPKESPLSLQISGAQVFSGNPTMERTVTSKLNPEFSFTFISNKNYLDFYDTYPTSAVGNNFMTRWAMYANTPLEKGMVEQLYPQIREKLAGLSKQEAVQQLLYWVQTGFEYAYDEDVWGSDRAFFGEESLFYPYCDCEDRSILLSHLVRDLVGLDVVLVYYPGHLAMAVNFPEEVEGDYLLLDGRKFMVCDPTYINAEIGMTMPLVKDKPATLILLDRD